VPDNSGTKACGIFACARKIWHAGCEVVKKDWEALLQSDAAVTIVAVLS